MKKFWDIADLALNGAQPAFSESIHVGRPNIGSHQDFVRLAGEILERRWLSNDGPLVRRFEKAICERLGVKECVAMCNGTVALEIAIRALGLEGEVIVPSYTFIATAHALHWQGITPVFADIDPLTHNLDPAAVRCAVTARTQAIIGVHLWGRPAPVAALQAIADEHGLQLMFDAAHAFDCANNGTPIGNFGACEVLSFHATKVFNTFEGGAVVTNDSALAEKMRLIRNFGFAGYDNVIYPGTNGKMTEISAAMGLVNLASLSAFIHANRDTYASYSRALQDIPGLRLLPYDVLDSPNYQYVVMEVLPGSGLTRDTIVDALHAENILARKYFWPGCHRMMPYRELFPQAGATLPHTIAVADRVVVLPTGPTLPPEVPSVVADVIRCLQVAAR